MAFEWLDDLGTSDKGVQLQLAHDVEGVVINWLYNLKDVEIPAKLREKGVEGTAGQDSKLAGSGTVTDVVITADGLKWSINMSDYWKYVEYGRGSSKVNQGGKVKEAIKGWITGKGISPSDVLLKYNKKRLPFPVALDTLSYLIARSIHKKGTIKRFNYGGSHFAKETLQQQLPELAKELERVVGKKVSVAIKNNLE